MASPSALTAGTPWLRSTPASAVGVGLAAALSTWPRGQIQGGTLRGELKRLGPLLLFGPLLSPRQWVVLRRLAPRASDWVAVTSASMLLA